QPRLPPSIEIACYRLVQEALTNVARHAQASQTWITLTQQSQILTLIIKDDGQGFDQADIRPVSLGLLGMRERVNMLNGNFSIESALDTGTIIRVTVPMAMNNEQ
ncbi:Sensor protein DegS, partial [hydrothermal vent metagenome]